MKSLKAKLTSLVAASSMVIAGLTPVGAQAAVDPYTVTAAKTSLEASADLVAAGNRVYWKSGNKLWTSDGTTTISVKTFTSANAFSLTQASPQYTEGGFWDYSTYINRSVAVGNSIYFWAASEDPSTPGAERWNIWKSDGTSAGTTRVTSLYENFQAFSALDAPTSLKKVGDFIYFWDLNRDDQGIVSRNLYRLNLTTNTAAIVAGVPTSQPCAWQSETAVQNQFETVGNFLVFDYGVTGQGTDCVTRLGAINLTNSTVSTITPTTVASSLFSVQGPQDFVKFGNKIYFFAMVGTFNAELWSTDGTLAGTTQVSNLKDSANGQEFGVKDPKRAFMRPFASGAYLYFVGYSAANSDYGIYRTNGVDAPELWIAPTALSGIGERTNVPGVTVTTNGTTYLVVDGKNSSGKQQMYSINMTTKAVTLLTPNLPQGEDSLGVVSMAWAATDYTAPVAWDGKVWWVARTNADNPGLGRNLFYTDGTVAGTAAATTWTSDNEMGIGYQGQNQIDQFATNATKPLAVTSGALWFLRGPSGDSANTWTAYRVSATPVTPPPPPVTCSNQMTKLKVEAESATDLSPAFSGNTCVYTMKVDNKTSKVEFSPTFTGSINVKVGGTSVTTSLKSGKTQQVNLGGAGTDTVVEFVFGANAYRVTVTRAAPATPGGRDPGFTAPSLPNGAVKSVDKDKKKEENQNGDKKDEEVTYVGGTFDGKVAKLDEHGKKDEEFSSKVPAISGTVEVVKVDGQHRIIVAGQNVDGDKDVVRLKPDGSKDKGFTGPDLGSGKKVEDVEVQKDGKIIIVGDFGDGKNAKKLKSDGDEDETFKNNLPNIPGPVKTAKIQDDGKILLGGSFDNADNDDDKDKIIRVEKNGEIDRDFEPGARGSHYNDDVEDIETQKDGKIIVVGKSNKSSNDEADKVTRLNKDGTEDQTFNFNGSMPSGKKVETVEVKDSGEMYIAGDFDDLGDGDGDKIAKVKKNGQVDTDWNPPTQGGDVHDIELQKHGKVFIAGDGSGDRDKVDKVEEDGDREGDDPRYDSIEDDRSANKVDSGAKGQTKIHGDGFKDGTTVTIGGKPAKVVKIDDRDEEITIQVPTPDNDHKGGPDHERNGADIVITVPDGQGGFDVIEVKDGFGYVDRKEPQVIKPENDNHINSDKDDEDGKGKVQDEETLAAYIPSGDPITHVSKTPTVCTVDENGAVDYLTRGTCTIVTDAPGDMGYADPAPITESIPVVGLDPQLTAPTLPDWSGDPAVPEVPETGFQLPAPPADDPSIPVTYTPTTPEVCDVTSDGVVTPIDPSQACTVQIATPGTRIYEPTLPTAPPVTVTIPAIAWLPPAQPSVPGLPPGTMQDPDVPSVSVPANGGTVKLGTDLGYKYDKAKGTLTPTAWGIYFGPIRATINYSWTNTNPATQVVTTGTGTCVVNWGVLKQWSKLSKADQKKFKKPLAAKVFTTTKNCKVNAAAKAALAKPGTTFSATSAVLRTRMWPATYRPEKPIIPGVRPAPVPIEPRLRNYTLTINTQ